MTTGRQKLWPVQPGDVPVRMGGAHLVLSATHPRLVADHRKWYEQKLTLVTYYQTFATVTVYNDHEYYSWHIERYGT